MTITIIDLSSIRSDQFVDANPGAHPLFHSDGGYQYTSPIFVRMLKDNGMEQSMSRVHSLH